MNKLFLRAASVVVSMLLVGCSGGDRSREHFDNAERSMKAEKFREAIVDYRNALRDDPKFGQARFRLAEAYAASGNPDQALREFVRAADLMPENNEAQIRAATYLVTAGSFEDAKTRILPVISRDPKNAQAQLLYGNALMGLKDLDGAIRELEKAINLDPAGGAAYSSLATARLSQGDREQAEAALTRAVKVNPKSARAHLALGYFYWGTERLDDAEAAFKTAVSVAPDDGLANRSIATFYAGTRRAEMAEPYLKTLAAAGNPAAILQLADFYLSLRRAGDATALLTPLVNDPANRGQAEVRLAAIAYESKDRSKASQLLDEVIQREPNNVQALVMKSEWLALEGKLREALGPAQAAVKSDPRSEEAHFELGTIQMRLRMRKEAIAEFNEVLRLNPRASTAQVYLSRLNLAEGSPENAVAFAEGALAAAPADPDARLSLVRALTARRDIPRAEQELATLLRTHPKAGAVHAADGNLKIRKKDYGGARAAFARALALSPTSTEALAGLVTLDVVEKKPAEARARVERALADDPNNVDLLMLAAQTYIAERNFALAEARLRKAIQSNPAASRAYGMLASVLALAGKRDAARAEFDELAKRDPKNVGAATMAAMLVESQGNKAEARKRYEAILNGTPTAAVAANNLAMIYQESGEKLDDALRLAQGAAARLPNSAEIQDTIGMIYYRKDLPALAVSAFERSVERAPDNAVYHYHLAMASAKAGDTRRAREAAEQAVKLKPDYADAQKLLAQTRG